MMEPVEPALEVPVVKLIEPLEPPSPAFCVPMVRKPLEVSLLCPLFIITEPPVLPDPAPMRRSEDASNEEPTPALTMIFPPPPLSSFIVLPVCRVILPLGPPVEAPVNTKIAPLAPSSPASAVPSVK